MTLLDLLSPLGADDIFVMHQPDTPRYARARQKLRFLVDRGSLLGVRRGEQPGTVEVAAWAPPGHGRGPGYYFCLRIVRVGQIPERAVLFCFWDGTESSPTFRTIGPARVFARSQLFLNEVTDEWSS